MLYRMNYNAHKYQDHSDPAVSRAICVPAKDLDALEEVMYEWRDQMNELALNGERKTYVGLLHFPA